MNLKEKIITFTLAKRVGRGRFYAFASDGNTYLIDAWGIKKGKLYRAKVRMPYSGDNRASIIELMEV